MKKLILATLFFFSALTVGAQTVTSASSEKDSPRIGLGQPAPNEPAKLALLKLTDPLVQRKYLNDPDMLRFLRGTYSDACSRGMLMSGATQLKANVDNKFTAEQQEIASKIVDSKRIWKMTSLEMETVFGRLYLKTSNYCDCMMREVSNVDLVDPIKGLEVISAISSNTQKTCDRLSTEKTKSQELLMKPRK
jgi:hypothetical protein